MCFQIIRKLCKSSPYASRFVKTLHYESILAKYDCIQQWNYLGFVWNYSTHNSLVMNLQLMEVVSFVLFSQIKTK